MELHDPRRHAETLRSTANKLSEQLQRKERVIRDLGQDSQHLIYRARNTHDRLLQDKLAGWDRILKRLGEAEEAATAARALVEEIAGLHAEAAVADAEADRREARERERREAEEAEVARIAARERRKEEQRAKREAEDAEAQRLATMTRDERAAEQRLAALTRHTG